MSEPIETGFLFVDGEYVAPPFVMRVENGEILVDDRVLAPVAMGFGHSRFGEWSSALQMNSILWIDGGRRRELELDEEYTLLKWIAGQRQSLVPDYAAEVEDEFGAWLAAFEPSSELAKRASKWTAEREDVWRENDRRRWAVGALDRYQYPLTLLGMVVATIALGHLLTSWTRLGDPDEEGRSEKHADIVWRSMFFVAFLSGLDLVWTVLSWQAGTMREVNPVAEAFVANPLVLSVFKVAATGIGVGLLVSLRRHRFAQQASLWLCTICMLLTFRWLTFQSMFAT